MHGHRAYAEREAAAFRGLELGPDDELVVVDNTGEGVAVEPFAGLGTVHEPVKGYLLEGFRNCPNRESEGTGLLTIGMR